MSEETPSKADEQARQEAEAQVKSELVFEGKKFSVRVDQITLADGQHYRREIAVHGGAVVMIPVTADGHILLVRQWRRATGEVLIELPAGTLEKGEPPAETAHRELQEEIGYKANKITSMGGFFSAPGILTEYLHLYLAEDLQESQLDPDEHEQIDVLKVPVDEALAMIERGDIHDAKTVAALCRYYIEKVLTRSGG